MSEKIISKQCCICKQTKPFSGFYKHPRMKYGYQSLCKDCYRDYSREYMRKYHKTQKGRKITQRYRASEKGKIERKRYYSRHPECRKARDAVEIAIKKGKLPRANTLQCHYCPKQAEQYHHYKGYAPEHWLDVVPICIPCHHSQEVLASRQV